MSAIRDSRQRALIWCVLIPGMLLPFIASLGYFVALPGQALRQTAYGATKAFTVLWPLAAVQVLRRSGLDVRPFPRIAANRRALALGLILGTAGIMVIFALMQTPLGDRVRGAAPFIRAKTVEMGLLEHYFAFAVVLSVLHSLLEEYYWRWFVYGELRGVVSRPAAHAIAAVSFALHHFVVVGQFFNLGLAAVLATLVGCGGALWSIMYERFGSLEGPWVCHMLIDLGLFAVGAQVLFATS